MAREQPVQRVSVSAARPLEQRERRVERLLARAAWARRSIEGARILRHVVL